MEYIKSPEEIKLDNGQTLMRRAFGNRAPKNDGIEKKPDMSLLPMDLLEEVAKAYEYGLAKYSRNSWRGGFEQHKNQAAALRHAADYWDKGELYDQDAFDRRGMKVMHPAMVIFNMLCIIDSIKNHPELDTRHRKTKSDAFCHRIKCPQAGKDAGCMDRGCEAYMCNQQLEKREEI